MNSRRGFIAGVIATLMPKRPSPASLPNAPIQTSDLMDVWYTRENVCRASSVAEGYEIIGVLLHARPHITWGMCIGYRHPKFPPLQLVLMPDLHVAVLVPRIRRQYSEIIETISREDIDVQLNFMRGRIKRYKRTGFERHLETRFGTLPE